MWSREDLKARGKFAFQRNYWTAVAVCVLTALLMGELFDKGERLKTTWSGVQNGYGYFHVPDVRNWFEADGVFSVLLALILSSIAGLVALLGILFKVLVGNAVKVGSNRFFMENREHKAGVASLLYVFKSGEYFNVILTMFLRDLFIFLWTMLLVVPGIVKSYEYRMVPYLLSENPGMSYHRAFEISRQMMDGQKMDTFILDLSFIGWYMLSLFTCNIAGIFYVSPYYEAVNGELYAVFRAHAFHTGSLSQTELPGFLGNGGYTM